MADFFATAPQFSSLSLLDLLRARDQFHAHLLHKANVVGTAIGRYLIRKDDPYPGAKPAATLMDKGARTQPKIPRTLENSEVRDYSWPAILVFVAKWLPEHEFGPDAQNSASDFVPKTIYLQDGKSVPVCVILAPRIETAPSPVASFQFPSGQISGGYPAIANVQSVEHVASIGCLVTNGHTLYALTSGHVTGAAGSTLTTKVRGETISLGKSAASSLKKLPFEKVYESWPGRHIYVNADAGLIEIEDQRRWSASVFGIGTLGPLADLSVENLTLNIIGCPVRASGCAGGLMQGRIAALFYRYRSVGGFEYVADFLIGSRDEHPLTTRPGDSGAIWVVDSDVVRFDRSPIAIQWGGTVFDTSSASWPFALATNLSTVCRELDVDIVRSAQFASFEYWGALGHYTIGALACAQVEDNNLRMLMMANRTRISFDPTVIGERANEVAPPEFVPLADVPDKVWKKVKSAAAPYGRRGPENPNHYADMDFENPEGKTLDDLTPTAQDLVVETWIDYYRSVHWNSVSERGLAPFRVWQIYKAMVGYIQASDLESFVAAAGVLAHYVGDLSQPLHTSYLTDGDPFMKPDGTAVQAMLKLGKGYGGGVHSAYEDRMLDAHVDDLLPKLTATFGASHGMQKVTGGQSAGFAGIELARRARQVLLPRALVESFGSLVANGQRSQAPEELWQQFGPQTITVLVDGCRTLAMLWDSAWAEGNGASIPVAQLQAVSTSRLQKIYEDQNFVPSVALGQIQQHL